jgi:hypothetical protein
MISSTLGAGSRGDKEVEMIRLFRKVLAEGGRPAYVVSSAAEKARIVWTYRLPKDCVVCPDKSIYSSPLFGDMEYWDLRGDQDGTE